MEALPLEVGRIPGADVEAAARKGGNGLGEVGTHAESPRPCAGEDHGMDCVIVARFGKGLAQILVHLKRQRVQLVGSGDADGGDVAVLGEFDRHVRSLPYWFFMFHLVPDLPEALIAGREDLWLRHFFSDWCFNPHTIGGADFDTYVAAYRAPGAVRGAMSDYRANAEDNAQDLVDAEVKIACPVLSLWGADFGAVGKTFDMAQVWSEMASDLKAVPIERCGHLPHEEQPEIVNRLLLDFLDGWRG